MRIIQAQTPAQLRQIMRDIAVDEYGIRIMTPKAISHLVKIDAISNITANILKQEMLSCGGDAAVARGALTGATPRTDCLLIGTLSQLGRLQQKLARQPFGLDALAKELSCALSRYQKDTFTLEACGRTISLGKRPYVMGIINLTPDSFSQDGLAGAAPGYIVEHAQRLVRDGADMIDIGGESTRPGARPVSAEEESRRVMPAIRLLAKKIKVPISIDTAKPGVARRALDNGAVIVNDITGLRQARMRTVVARAKAGAVIMHMQGNPRTMQRAPAYGSLIGDILSFLAHSMKCARDSGISPQQLIIDPGIGFGKTLAHNLELVKRAGELKATGRPVLIGVSRKAFIGTILKRPPDQRVYGTVSACLAAVANGAKIVRVHDVRAVKDALRIFNSINQA